MNRTTVLAVLATSTLLIGSAACTDDGPTGATDPTAALTDVSPAPNSTNVSPNGTINITFDHPMRAVKHLLVHPFIQTIPVASPDQDDWKSVGLSGLDERHGVEKFVQRTEPAGKANE